MSAPLRNHNPDTFKAHPAPRPERMQLRARITRIVDGDTFDCEIEALPHIAALERVRLAGIDTPEIFGPNKDPERGQAAVAFVEEKIGDGWVMLMLHAQRVTLGRVVADVFYHDGHTFRDLANALREAGHAK